MAIRVPVEIRISSGASICTSALLNTGFESERPEILIPVELARRLGFYPQLPQGTVAEQYDTVAGAVILHRIAEPVTMAVRVEGHSAAQRHIQCQVLVSGYEREVVMNDCAMAELGIEVINPRDGIWRFSGETQNRQGVGREQW
jgi:hypothetical protein